MNQQLPRLTFEQAKRAHSFGVWLVRKTFIGPRWPGGRNLWNWIYETLDGTIPPLKTPYSCNGRKWKGFIKCRSTTSIFFQPVYTRLYGSWEKGSRIYQTYPEAESALIDQDFNSFRKMTKIIDLTSVRWECRIWKRNCGIFWDDDGTLCVMDVYEEKGAMKDTIIFILMGNEGSLATSPHHPRLGQVGA